MDYCEHVFAQYCTPTSDNFLDHTIKRGVNRIHIDVEKVSFMC